jgi:hypothetical protein
MSPAPDADDAELFRDDAELFLRLVAAVATDGFLPWTLGMVRVK